MYSLEFNIVSLLCVSLLFISTTNGQCGADCSTCDNDPTNCPLDTTNNCIWIADVDAILGGSPDAGICRVADTCASQCDLCFTDIDCSASGLCLWLDPNCLPASCDVTCTACGSEPQCLASTAPPNGCVMSNTTDEGCEAAVVIMTTPPPEDCPPCPFGISLISIGNITIEPCPPEPDCLCDVGLTSFTVKYLNEISSAATITFYDDQTQTTVSCPPGEDVANLEDVVCTIDPDITDRFGITTYFVIEYTDTSLDDCVGSFDTSCTEDILGTFGDGCSDLVITSWTDEDGGVCTGNVSLTITVSGSSSSSSSSDSTEQRFWLFTDADESSSGSRRRRMMTRRRGLTSSSSSGSSSGGSTFTSWYSNKLCVPNCLDWGAARGIDCGCYESCTVSALNESCYEGTTAGYCGTGVCCCGGQCITSECDYGSSSSGSISSSSDTNTNTRRLLGSERCSVSSSSSSGSGSGDGYYSFTEWYEDRCEITETTTSVFTSSGSSSSSSSNRRRRQLVGASFGSSRQLQSSSSSSSSSGYTVRQSIIKQNELINDFIIETCIVYQIIMNGTMPDCVLSITIFLPLCENEFTDFNTTNLNASDITGLITDQTFDDGTNISSAIGAEVDGQLGILITLTSLDVASFEICVGNVTVNGENIDSFNITVIDTSEGIVWVNSTDGSYECPIDGLPCFNFFFDAECPPVTTLYDSSIYRSCDCDDGMVSMDLEYIGSEAVTVTIHRRMRQRGAVLAELDVVPNDTMTVTSDPYSKFAWGTGFTVTDSSGEELCSGYVRKCVTWTVGAGVAGCEDYLVLTSWTAGDGALCDAFSVILEEDSSSTSDENLLISGKEILDTPLKVFKELDPYVKYSMVGVLVSFFALLLVAGYICIVRKARKRDEDTKDEMETARTTKSIKGKKPRRKGTDSIFSEYGVEEEEAEAHQSIIEIEREDI